MECRPVFSKQAFLSKIFSEFVIGLYQLISHTHIFIPHFMFYLSSFVNIFKYV